MMRLEARLRSTAACLVVVAAFAAFGALAGVLRSPALAPSARPDPAAVPARPPGAIEATSFTLRDALGRSRITMNVLPDGSSLIGVTDAAGEPQAMLLSRGNKDTAFSIPGASGSGIVMSVNPRGEAQVVAGEARKAALIAFPGDGPVGVQVRDARDRVERRFP